MKKSINYKSEILFSKCLFINGKNAFTLVEIIVVIGILSILSVIVFISINGYAEQSRDSARISDLFSIKTSLELFQLESGNYPVPSDGVDITYSGAVIFNQGRFGDSVYANVYKLDRLPIDPATYKQYTYSISTNKNEYQLGGIMEGDTLVMNNEKGIINNFLLNDVSAGNVKTRAYVTGNFNGFMIKSLSGSNCDILSLPSIITNNNQITSDIVELISNNDLVYNGFDNLPSSYNGTKFKIDGGFKFIPNNFVSYSDSDNCSVLLSKTNHLDRLQLLKGLQNSYKGTILENDINIKSLLDLNIDFYNPSLEVINYASTFVNNNLGGKISIDTKINNVVDVCDGLFGDANELNNPGVYDYFDLCNEVISIYDLANIDSSSNLTNNHGARDVYRFELEIGKTYNLEIMSPFNNTDTIIFLYDKDGNKISMNDDIDANNSNYKSRIVYTASYSGYYYLGVMGFEDGGLLNDYTLGIMNNE
ncbi:MAG: pre-peptidase C-terminal domain-containing protein [Candidatus Gracilibacteria bacterium]|nr:pre-peptidase C-terminal domain-containing protein [Candidatus Gracilibacteria bacterium]